MTDAFWLDLKDLLPLATFGITMLARAVNVSTAVVGA